MSRSKLLILTQGRKMLIKCSTLLIYWDIILIQAGTSEATPGILESGGVPFYVDAKEQAIVSWCMLPEKI